MKKALLFAILAISLNVLAQSKHLKSNLLENIRVRMENTGREISNRFSEINFGRPNNHQRFEQGDFIQIYDSVYWWRWDTLIMGWKKFNKEIQMVYDTHYNLTDVTHQRWTGSEWENSFYNGYTYDSSNNQISELWQEWNGSDWVNYILFTISYDVNNNMKGFLEQNWNNNVWVDNNYTTYSYIANNKLKNDTMQHWNGSTWVIVDRSIYTYDSVYNRIKQLDQFWNGSIWENNYQYTYTYNGNNDMIGQLNQVWNGNEWVDEILGTFIYNSNDNTTTWLRQSWNGSIWVNWDESIYSFDVNNFWRSYSTKTWDSTGTIATPSDSMFNYYHTVGIDELMMQQGNFNVYPNPSSAKFTISSKSNINAVEIYNLLGERIYSEYGIKKQTSTEIDLIDHCKGIYIVKIYIETKIYNRKIIVQ